MTIHLNNWVASGCSLHGLVRGENMELGRDSDTGGQVTLSTHKSHSRFKFVLEISSNFRRLRFKSREFIENGVVLILICYVSYMTLSYLILIPGYGQVQRPAQKTLTRLADGGPGAS